ncbi:MAG: carnitine dehydratase [Rhodospirillaceae bacterium]|nr:carnitine dehydratase [Rhodospirillaceae bacterium]
MPGPLEGYRVIDMTSVVSGPLATMMLGDQGAEVIKVENPDGGDFTRAVSNRRGGYSAAFLNNNRSKRSVAINTKDPRGMEVVKKLLIGADVFIQNMRPGVIQRMGLGEATVREIAPEIIYVSISGFGERGPYADRPVYDPLVQALSGLTTIQGGSDEARPRLVRTIVPDKLTGVMAAQAITAALLSRERTGQGQHVRLSMLDSVVNFLWHSDMGSQTFVGGEFPQEKAQSFIDLIYETTEGHISVAVNTDKQWANLANALGHPEWLSDPRFATPALRHQNIDSRLSLTQSVLATNTAAHWLKILEEADVPCAPILRRCDVIHHPQIQANETVSIYEHPHAGPLRQTRPAARFSLTDPVITRGAPTLGEYTLDVLLNLGYDHRMIETLIAEGVIGAYGFDKAAE